MLEIVPMVPFPPRIPFTFHVVAVLLVPLTVAVNCRVWDTVSVSVEGETLTLTPG